MIAGVLSSSTILVLSAPLLQLHSMWVAVVARKSLPATLAETTVIDRLVTTRRNQPLPLATPRSPSLKVGHDNSHPQPLTLPIACKIGSVVYKIGQSWSSCCAKSWLCSRGCSVILQIGGPTLEIFLLNIKIMSGWNEM